MAQEIAAACYLTGKQLQERRKNYLDKAAGLLIDSAELENGLSFRFPLENSILEDLANIIELERKCCPFLNFKLILEAGSDSVALELTGAEGTKEMIRELFAWN